MSSARRPVAIGLAAVVALGGFAVAVDASTIRLDPNIVAPTVSAIPGQLIEVHLGSGFTSPRSSDPAVVSPLGTDWFIAAQPGRATLHAVSILCARCEVESVLWRADILVGIPGA